ncbi:DUF971 domain-containing protein [Neisseriaceae bacterium ESL0693]|nr:DUF971 domain-containing protein [Neisseriaceae bacterium ESL0693]
MQYPMPDEIRLNTDKTGLKLVYADQVYLLSAEYLRVFSPSAEVRGHGVGQEVLQTGKRAVLITGLAPMGNYAVKISFSDGHDSGLYDWDYLYDLALQRKARWADYERQLQLAGASREPDKKL